MKKKYNITGILVVLIASILVIACVKTIEMSNTIEWVESDCAHSSYVWSCHTGEQVAYCLQYHELLGSGKDGTWVIKRRYKIGGPEGYKEVTKEEAQRFCASNIITSKCGDYAN